MYNHPFDGRTALRALTGLDLGLRVRVQLDSRQRPIFSGPENLTALHLILYWPNGYCLMRDARFEVVRGRRIAT